MTNKNFENELILPPALKQNILLKCNQPHAIIFQRCTLLCPVLSAYDYINSYVQILLTILIQ